VFAGFRADSECYLLLRFSADVAFAMTYASRFAFLPERLAAIIRNACATCSLHHALIELKDNPVRILEQAR